MIFFPCPERHVDTGAHERLISAARARLNWGMNGAEVLDELCDKGHDVDDVYLAITAALLLNDWSMP